VNRQLESVWAYLGELIAAALLLVALNLLIGVRGMVVWLAHQQTNLTSLLIVGAAATAITFGAFFAILTTEFGMAMRRAKEAKAYIVAFALPLLLFVATLALVTLGNSDWGSLYTECCIFLLLYSTLNLITMVKNVIDLGGLWQDFDRARKDGKRP
jgi:hypothetical protein